LAYCIEHLCDNTLAEVYTGIFSKLILNTMYKKQGVWLLKTAQTFRFHRAENVVFGISNENCTVNVVRCDSNILQ
jgi:hypothetical protein